EQKLARKNELKAHGTLLMALPDKHQLKFNSHKDAKTLMEAIEKRFRRNTKTKKVQKTLLKQQFENFSGSHSESLDQIHDRLQKLVSQLEIHGVSLSQEDVNLKFLQSIPSEWKTRNLIWRNNADLEEQSLDDFTTDLVSATASVSAVCAKMHVSSSLPNVDSLSNAIIYSLFASQSTSPWLDNEDLKQIDVDDLEEMDLRWQMGMLTMRARRFLRKTGRNLGANGSTSMGFDMSKVECYNCHRKRNFSRECGSPKDSRRNGAAEPQRRTIPIETSTSNDLVSQCDGVRSYDWSYQAEEELANYALMAFLSLSSSSDNEVFTHAMFDCDDYISSESDCESWPPTSLYDRFQLSDGYHDVPPPYIGTFMPPKPDLVFNTAPTAVETVHPAFNAPYIVPSFVQSSEQVKSPRHSIQHVKTSILAATPKPASLKSSSNGNRRNRKACFVCKSLDHLIKDCDYDAKKMAQPTPRNHAHRGNHKKYAPLTHTNPYKHMVPAAVLTQSNPVSITAVRPVSAAVPKIKVTRPRHGNLIVTKSKSPIRRHITHSPSPKTSNHPPRVTAVKDPVGNPQHTLKDKGVIDSGCSRHITGNMSYLFDFEELNRGYVAFGGNLVRGLPTKVFENDHTCVACKKGKEHRASCKTKPVSFVNQPLYKLHMDLFGPTFVKSLNKKSYCLVVTDDYSRFTWVFFLATKDETSFILKTFITGLENQLSLKGIKREFSVPSTPQQNGIAERKNRTLIEAAKTMLADSLLPIPLWAKAVNTAFYVQNSSAQSRKQDDKTKKEAKGKSHVESLTGYKDLSVEFKDCSDNSINENNDRDAAFDGKEHDFDAKKHESEVSVSPSSSAQSRKQDDKTKKEAKGKSHVESLTGYKDLSVEFKDCSDNSINEVNAADASQLPDDPDMPELDDITYSDDKDDVGAEADFNNLETSITEELLQFKMQKVWVLVDCHMEKDPLVPNGFSGIKRMKEALWSGTKAWYETLANYLLENGFQRGKIDQTLSIKRQKGDILLVQIYVDDIIFGATNKDLCKSFKNLIKDKFKMSSMGELTFFLGLQVKQKKDGIFISQDKYVAKILKKFGLTEGKSASTPIDTEKPLLKDPDGEDVDVHTYRSTCALDQHAHIPNNLPIR
nr:putative ribonuclease H-like domain-containing protein [Tanacetum cinerariifolium]